MEIFGCPHCETEWLHWGQKVCPDCGGAMKWYDDALTVSRQEEPTVTKPTCEQPTHDLSKEVHTDILWRSREGEPM